MAAVARRLSDGVNHRGEQWRPMAVYPCPRCAGWHYTTTAYTRRPNYGGGGWAREQLLDTIELGDRVSVNLRMENNKRRVSGLSALRRKRRQRKEAA